MKQIFTIEHSNKAIVYICMYNQTPQRIDSPTERIITLRITSERITSERINTERITSERITSERINLNI
jgi:hypothetical protein